MLKNNLNIPSIYDIGKYLKKENALPVYFFCGTDAFTIENAIKALLNSFADLIESEFDKETISADKNLSVAQIIDAAYAFPFGGGKKILVINSFNNISNRKELQSYVENPSDSTILIISYLEKVSNYSPEPFATLVKKGFLFNADQLKGAALANWVKKQFEKRKIKISSDTSALLIDQVGEDKSLLEMQIIKLSDFIGEGGEVSAESIMQHASKTKEFNIFDLQDAISAGDKKRTFEVMENLLEKGNEINSIIASLVRYISTVSQSKEFKNTNVNDFEASKKIGISKYFYTKCKNARYFNSFAKLHRVVESLLSADIRVKTSAMNPKHIGSLLVAEMFGE